MNIARSFANWRKYRQTVVELDRMSNRELTDLGIAVRKSSALPAPPFANRQTHLPFEKPRRLELTPEVGHPTSGVLHVQA